MKTKYLILSAHAVSLLFNPLYMPVAAFVVMMWSSYMSYTPVFYRLRTVLMVYIFTVLLPHMGISLYRKARGWTHHELGLRERRFVPYVLSILSYAVLLYIMHSQRMPRFTLVVVATALLVQVACALVNMRTKVSTHAAAQGGGLGLVMAFALVLRFNPIRPLIYLLLLCGVVCSARCLLRQHSPAEVGLGVLVGLACALVCVALM